MDCKQMRDQLLRGNREGVAAHGEECPACAELLLTPELFGELRREPAIDATPLWQDMQEALAHQASWWNRGRNLATRWRYGGALAGLGALGVLVAAATLRADASVVPPEYWALLGLWVLLSAISVWAWLRPRHWPDWSASSHRYLLFSAVALVGLQALLPELHGSHPTPLGAFDTAKFLHQALACFVSGSAGGALGLSWGLWFLQGHVTLRSIPSSAWALGVLFGNVLLTLHCPLMSWGHLALGHASIGVVVLAGVEFADWRSRTLRGAM